MREIVRRIEREAGVPNLSKILADRIKPTDLQSLLLKVYQEQVKRRTLRTILSDYAVNSFTLPSRCSPSTLLEWDRIAFSHLPSCFSVVELSPVSPLGSVSAMAPVSQNWILTTIRNNEVVADPTNSLALECALRRRKLLEQEPSNATPVHLACSHRVLRAQRYESPSNLQHFRVFALCSAGRNTKKLRFDTYSMFLHVRFYIESLRAFLGPHVPLRVKIIDLASDYHDEERFDTPLKNLKTRFANVDTAIEQSKTKANEYYREFRFKVYVKSPKKEEIELVDGGATDWTQKLLSNAKERLTISGIGSERLCQHFTPTR
jgi:hypothetical protein